jgi:archaetidylinositol phosphate synthase
MKRPEFFSIWSSSHGGAEITGIVKGWLVISYFLVKPLKVFRISPNLITFGGLFFAIGVWRYHATWLCLLFLALSLLCDGLDGSLAIYGGSQSNMGAVLDATVDRISEVFWALAFYKIGANLEVVFAAWLLANTQEYARARIGGLGIKVIGVVTIAERPVRASLLAIALIINLCAFKNSSTFVEIVAILWLVMQSISFISVIRFGYLELRKN